MSISENNIGVSQLRIFVLLCVFIGGLGQGVVNPKLPEILKDQSHLAINSGISASLMYMAIFLASFVYGKVADRGYVFRLLMGGLIAYSVVLISFIYSHSVNQVFILRFLEGLSLSAMYIAADVVLCRASSDKDRGQWLSYYGVAISIGLLLGPAMLLLVSFVHGQEDLAVSLLVVAGLALLFSIVSFFFRLPSTGAEPTTQITHKSAAMGAVLYGFFEAGLVAVLSAVIAQSFSGIKVEVIFTVLILSAALASIVWGILIDKIGGKNTFAWVCLSLAVSLGLVSFLTLQFTQTFIIYLAAVGFGIAAGGIYPAGFAWLVTGVPASGLGYASGYFTRAYGLGSLVGPLVFGFSVDRLGANGLFVLSALVGLAGFIFAKKSSMLKG